MHRIIWKAQEGDVPQPADVGQAERTPLPDRSRRHSQRLELLTKQLASGAGRDGGAERESPDAVARHAMNSHPQPSGGSDTGRTDLQLEPEKRTEK